MIEWCTALEWSAVVAWHGCSSGSIFPGRFVWSAMGFWDECASCVFWIAVGVCCAVVHGWSVACVLVLYLAGRAFTDCVRIPGLHWDCCGIVDCGFLCGVVEELDGSSWIALMN